MMLAGDHSVVTGEDARRGPAGHAGLTAQAISSSPPFGDRLTAQPVASHQGSPPFARGAAFFVWLA